MRPKREHATNTGNTYMVTSPTWERRPLFRSERWAKLFLAILEEYRGSGYLLHEFVVMPDHFHVLITPLVSLERAAQFIKGGFSFRAKQELGSNLEIWQKGFADHRIRDLEDYYKHVRYIRQNPVRAKLVQDEREYPYSSATRVDLDPIPQRLKPHSSNVPCGAPECAPFQNKNADGGGEVPLIQKVGERQEEGDPQRLKPDSLSAPSGAAEAAPFQSTRLRAVSSED